MIEDALAWAAIGAAGGLAGMTHPFPRGVVGVMFNLAAGVAGAMVVGAVGALAMKGELARPREWSLCFAALGALAAVLVAHTATERLRLSKSR
jgi:hypothetical protein